MTGDADREGLAAEYVLGTLDDAERAQAQALLGRDASFAALVQAWERRIAVLHELVEPVEPPAHVWPRIAARLGGATRSAGAEVIDLRRRLRRWRTVSAMTGALAACLALFVAAREFAPGWLPPLLQPAAPEGRYVALLQRDQASPGFILTVDLKTRSFTARPVGAQRPPARAYELWLVHDRFPQPRSLGVIGDGEFTTRAALTAYDREIINTATYAVSVEPPGGSPTGIVTGPVVFVGKLIEVLPK